MMSAKQSKFPLIKTAQVADLIPYARNSRTHSDEQITQIAASIKEFGFLNPVIVDGENGIIAGHGRVMAAKKLGMTELPVVEASHLTDAQRRAYIIADNKLALNAGWDDEMLRVEFAELTEAGFDLDLTGFTLDEIGALQIEEIPPGLTDEDAVPDTPVTPVTVEGGVWLLGRHRLMCGDSTSIDAVERLMDGRRADMVFTDPPYGIGFVDQKGNEIKNDKLNDEKMAEFNRLWQGNADIVAKGDCFLMVWQSPRKFHLLDYFGSWSFFRLITMYKSNRISFPHGAWINKTEPCCVFSKGSPRITKQEYMDDCYVYKHEKESHEDSNVGHPTPKPVKMVASNVVACAKQDDIVLDLFGGSGSTLIACEKTGRIGYLMELDPKYCDVIIKRWQDFTGKQATLEATGETFEELTNARLS
jgi:DNA modification methylase